MRRTSLGLFVSGMMVICPLAVKAQPVSSAPPTSTASTASSNFWNNLPDSSADAHQFNSSESLNRLGKTYPFNWFSPTPKPEDVFARTDFSIVVAQQHKPTLAAQTIQPIYRNFCNTWFGQGGAAYNSGNGIYDIGAGYRFLTSNKMWLWGLNLFYSQSDPHAYKNIGLGGEVFTPYLVLRANYYNAISGKTYETSASGNLQIEQALNGVDASIEMPVPWVSFMRFTVGGYHWNGDLQSSVNGESARFRLFADPSLEIDFGAAHDNRLGLQKFISVDYYFGSPAFIERSAISWSCDPTFYPLNLDHQRLQKVLRRNDPMLEKWG